MSVSMATDSYLPTNLSVISASPVVANATGGWERDPLLAVAEVAVLSVIFVMALLGNGLVLVVLPQLVWDARGSFPGPDLLCRLVFIFSRSEVAPGVYECWGTFAGSWGLKAYVTWMTLAIFIVPVLIITICQSEGRLFPASLPPSSSSRRDSSQRGGAAGLGRLGRSSLSLVALSYHGNKITSRTESSNQHLPMGPLRSKSFPISHSDDLITAGAQPEPAEFHTAALRGRGISAAMSKTVRMTLVIVVVYSVCWAPFFSVQLWAAWAADPPQ
ncbi:hypothetical protein CRUP_038755, partial [Coryphaenoides rupestris]